MSTYPPQYPPFYPTLDPPPPPVPERLLVNGVDLGSYAFMTTDVSSLFTVPAKRGSTDVVAGRHGAIRRDGKRFDTNEIVLPMWIVGSHPDGTVPWVGEQRAFFQRRDELLRLFHGDDVTLSWTRPDSTTVTATAEVVDIIDFTRSHAQPLARVSVALEMPTAFWSETADVSQTITGTTGATAKLTRFAGTTAPITDSVITFYGPVSNPRLAIGQRWVQYNGVISSGRQLVLDCGHWHVSSGSGPQWSPDVRQVYREPGPAWLEIPPSYDPLTVTFTHTGGTSSTVEISGRRKYLSP